MHDNSILGGVQDLLPQNSTLTVKVISNENKAHSYYLNQKMTTDSSWIYVNTVFPHKRPAGNNFSLGLQVRVLLEITKFHLHKSVPTAGIIRVAGIIRGRRAHN